MRWRTELARQIGIPLNLMDGFYDEPYQPALDWAAPRDGGPICGDPKGPFLHDWIKRVDALLPLPWVILEDHPLHVLLRHSDSDGEIEDGLISIADGLEYIASGGGEACCPSNYPSHWRCAEAIAKGIQRADYDGFYPACRRFAAGCRAAAFAGEPLRFG